jgi:nucleotide-binding universal stress UspA family protein
VPVDFDHDVDAALTAARTVAPPYMATVTLLSALEPPAPAAARLQPATTAVMRDYQLADLRRRLEGLAERIRRDLGVVRPLVADRPPTEAILAAADSLPADLIVLVTDAHAGLSSWFARRPPRSCCGTRT